MEEIRKFLESKGVHPSYHRIKIMQYLMEHRTHPTVETIYKDLHKEIPTLSKTTIYNTLNLFAEKGLVTVLTIDERETRYDVETETHAHFKCKKCGKVYDIFLDKDVFKDMKVNEHHIEEIHLYFKGICKNCMGKSN